MKSMVTRPNTVVGGSTVSSGDGGTGGATNGETDKSSAKLAGSKSGPKGDHVTTEKTNEVKKKAKLQRLEVGPQKLNDKHGVEKCEEKALDVPLPLEADIPLPPHKPNDVKDKDGANNKEGSSSDKEDDSKSGVVSFSFKKTGAKLGMAAFNSEEDDKQDDKPDVKPSDKPKKITSAFIKVKNKDGTMELDWPSEMIQHTTTQPVIMFSCNPLMFDFTALFSQPNSMSEKLKFLTEEDKKEEANEKVSNLNSVDGNVGVETSDIGTTNDITLDNSVSGSKSKSKKKKKRKHKKHKASKDEKDKKEHGGEGDRKKKKKKRKHDDKDENKENKESVSKKRSYRKRTADGIVESGNESGDKKVSKHKKRKKSKKTKKRKKETVEKNETKKVTEKTPKKIKAKKSSNVLEHLIDEVDGTDTKIKKDNTNENDGKTDAKKSKSAVNNVDNESKQVIKTPILDGKLNASTINMLKVEKEAGTGSARKRQTSESSHSEATPSSVKKQKLTPRLSKEPEKSIPVKQEDSWSKMENIFEPKMEENPKSKWDTSDSDSENKMDATLKQKKLTKKAAVTNPVKKENPTPEKTIVKNETVLNKKAKSKSYDSSERSYSRSRSRSRRSRHSSYSHSSSRSRSRSYSTSSYDSRSRSSSYSRSRSRSRRYRSSSYSSYSSGYSRSRSRSSRGHYSRSRSRYSSYSRSRSRSSRYSTSRSRSRSYSRSRSRHSARSYSQSSHSSHDSTKVMNRKQRRRKILKKQTELNKIDPLNIPLPDLGKDSKPESKDINKPEEKQEKNDMMNIPLPSKKDTNEKNENVNLLAPPPPPPGEQKPQNIPPPVMSNFLPPPPPPGMGMGPPGMYPGMPYDQRMRMPPPHFQNMPPPHYNGPYHGPHSYPQDISKSRSPPPLPPPRSPSPQPPPPPKKEEEKKEVEAMSMDIPADQAEKFQKLQKQAQKHAMRQLKRQMRQLKGENPSDESSSSESEEEKTTASQQGEEMMDEDVSLYPIMSPSLSLGQPTYIIAQPQQTSSPLTHQIVIGSDGRQFIIPAGSASSLAGAPIQAGAPVFAMPGASQPTLVALPAGAGATPAHLTGAVQSPFLHGGFPLGASSILQHHPLFAAQQQLALQHLHQPHMIPTSLGHGAIMVGNQILIPRIIRPAI